MSFENVYHDTDHYHEDNDIEPQFNEYHQSSASCSYKPGLIDNSSLYNLKNASSSSCKSNRRIKSKISARDSHGQCDGTYNHQYNRQSRPSANSNCYQADIVQLECEIKIVWSYLCVDSDYS